MCELRFIMNRKEHINLECVFKLFTLWFVVGGNGQGKCTELMGCVGRAWTNSRSEKWAEHRGKKEKVSAQLKL